MKLQIAGANPNAARIIIGEVVTRHKRRTRRLSDYAPVGRFYPHTHGLAAELLELGLALLIGAAFLAVLLAAGYFVLASPLLRPPYLP